MIHLGQLLYELRLLSHQHGDWNLFTVQLSPSEMHNLFEKIYFTFINGNSPVMRLSKKSYNVTL